MSDQSQPPGPPEGPPPGGGYYPQQGGGYYPQQGGGYYPPQGPPKKRRTWLWVTLGIIAFFFVGCTALVVAAGDAMNEAAETTVEESDPTPEEPTVTEDTQEADEPQETETPSGPGPVTVGNWEVQGGMKALQPKADAFNNYTLTFRVLNTGDSADTGIFTVNVLKGDEILTSMDCITGEVEPGGIGTADCLSADEFQSGWTQIEIVNTF